MAKIAYVRVSTVEQNEQRQVSALEPHNIEKWYIEKTSGKNTDREQFQAMLEYARENDTIYVHDLSRLARSTADLLRIVEELSAKGISLVSNKENFDTSTATGKLMLTMIGAINEFERSNTLERQREGISLAKRAGKYKGRKAVHVVDFGDYYERYMRREVSKAALARELGVSRPTLDRLIREHTRNDG